MLVWRFLLLVNAVATNFAQPDPSVDEDEGEMEELCVNNNLPLTVTKTLNIGGNDSAWVIDNSIQPCTVQFWLSSLQHRDSVVGFEFNFMNYTKHGDPREWNYGSSPWSKALDAEKFASTNSWKKLSKTVEDVLKQKMKIVSGRFDLLRVLDAMPPRVQSDCVPGQYTLSIFLNKMWNLNNYAQVSFYNIENGESGEGRWEISASVHPHSYRAILWPSCHPVLFRAPCINHFFHFNMLNLKLSADINAKSDSTSDWYVKGNVEDNFSRFAFKNPSPVIDFSKHLVRTFNDGDPSRQVNIFDGVFTREELLEWRTHLLRFHPGLGGFDAAPLEDHDNVQWVGVFSVDAFLKTAMWPRLEALCEYVSNHKGWHPYDVALNYVRSGDHTRIHPDSERHQHELTMVLYLNEDLTPSDFGETTFYVMKPDDGVHQFVGDGGEIFEAIGTVAPKFGRVAIFTNNIEHSAHPPSNLFVGGRYTFALKVSKSRRLALIKMAYEKMEMIDMNSKMQKLKRSLETGQLDSEGEMSTEKLASFLKNIRTQAKERMLDMERSMNERIQMI